MIIIIKLINTENKWNHLQIYSCYSFQRSTVMINDLIEEAKKKNLKYLTLTDKDNIIKLINTENKWNGMIHWKQTSCNNKHIPHNNNV